MGIKSLADEARVQYEGSQKITKLHVNAILSQSNQLPGYDEQGHSFKKLKWSIQTTRRTTIAEQRSEIAAALQSDTLNFVKQARGQGSKFMV